MDKKKDGNMLNIKTEEQVTKKTVHKVGVWLTLRDLKKIMNALSTDIVGTAGDRIAEKTTGLWLDLKTIREDAKRQINETALDIEADDIMLAEEEDARNGEACDVEGCE